MANDSEILRKLHKIQVGVPDKDFFANIKSNVKAEGKARKKAKTGFLAGKAFGRVKKASKIDIEIAREKIKSFNNSFKFNRGKKQQTAATEPGIMSIQEMNEFRNTVKESAETEEESYSYRALEGIVKFIDLKNSGVVTGKQDVLFDSLKNIALVLMENGGLSMFHATWFYTIYKEYITHFRMFPRGELEMASKISSKEVRDITAKLVQKQYEIPLYLKIVDERKRDIRQLLRYSKDPYVKRSIHGQQGCSFEHIQKVFQERSNPNATKVSSQNYLNEVNIIQAYALFFSRFPMLHPLVEKIAKSIPNIDVETNLLREKILVSLNLIQLDLIRGSIGKESGGNAGKHLFDTAYNVFSRCKQLIVDYRLQPATINSDIQTFPFLKQAAILIGYKQIFFKKENLFIKMVENSKGILGQLKDAAQSGNRYLSRAYDLIEVYDSNLAAIAEQIKSELSSPTQSQTKKPDK